MGQVSNETLLCWADIFGCFAADNFMHSVLQVRGAIDLATATSVTLQVVVQVCNATNTRHVACNLKTLATVNIFERGTNQ